MEGSYATNQILKNLLFCLPSDHLFCKFTSSSLCGRGCYPRRPVCTYHNSSFVRDAPAAFDDRLTTYSFRNSSEMKTYKMPIFFTVLIFLFNFLRVYHTRQKLTKILEMSASWVFSIFIYQTFQFITESYRRLVSRPKSNFHA